MTDAAKNTPLDADACIDIATELINDRDAIIARLEEELERVRWELAAERERCFQWVIGRSVRSRVAQAIRDGESVTK